MRNDLPPVKSTTSGKQVKVYITLPGGTPEIVWVSDEVNGKYHVVVPSTEFWITEDELNDARRIFNE